MSDTITTEGPLSREETELPVDVEVDEAIDSPATGAGLEAVSLGLMILEEAPELEEDWGE